MKNHLALLSKSPHQESEAEKLASALRGVLSGGGDGPVSAVLPGVLGELTKELKVMHHHIHEVMAKVAVGGKGNGEAAEWKKLHKRFDSIVEILENS